MYSIFNFLNDVHTLMNVWTTIDIKNGYILLTATPPRHRSG